MDGRGVAPARDAEVRVTNDIVMFALGLVVLLSLRVTFTDAQLDRIARWMAR